jgi:hypothetical protein
MSKSRRLIEVGSVSALGLLVAVPAHAGIFDDIGYTALVARLGVRNVPTGAGYAVGQVEAQESAGNYGPDVNNADFAGTSFTAQTGPFGLSGHATTVGLNLYGNTASIAPGVNSVFIWEAGSWATSSYLKTNQGATPPSLPPAGLRIFNHSWIGSFGDAFVDNNALRRFDFAIQRDNLVAVLGTNNGAGSPASALMAYGYNGITVGLENGNHCNAVTPANLDGQNRRKPEIVAPGSFTSFSTPIVGAAAALLLSTTDVDPGLAANPNADKSIVLKSVLLAGAKHRDSWSNGAATNGPSRGSTTTPLDPVYGADLLNIDRSHFILTSQEKNGATSLPATTNVKGSGWDFVTSIASNTSVFYRFKTYEPVDEVSILATWNRSVASSFGSFTLMDIDLTLWKVGSNGALVSLVGDAGIPVYGSGNVSSTSSIDNIEHLYLRDVAAGEYVLEVKRKTGVQTSLPVAVSWYVPKTTLFGDLNDDDLVDAGDLGILLGSWSTAGLGDLNADGIVNASDLALLLGAWT